MAKRRCEVELKDQWRTDTLYKSWEEWESELKACVPSHPPTWPKLEALKGKLAEGKAALREALEELLSTSRILEKLYTFASLKQDEDLGLDEHKAKFSLVMAVISAFRESTAWFEPELLALPDHLLSSYLEAEELKPYRFYLERLIRKKPHTLSHREEELAAMAARAFTAPSRTFGMLTNVDLRFGSVPGEDGKEHEVTQASYGPLMRVSDRILRQNAFQRLHGRFKEYQNTFAELLLGAVQAHLFEARAHRFGSCLEAAIFPNQIDPSVYHNLIRVVNEELPKLHRYINLRRRALKLDALHLYDLSVPLVPNVDRKMSYDEAAEVVVASCAPLGAEYQRELMSGLHAAGWVDRYQNEGKRSGAYSSGCYDSVPYILMNFEGTIQDVYTLAHEAGHSMHSYLTHRNQPYHYGDYSIFIAEVASTFNEELLFRELLRRAQSKEERCALINQKIDGIRATLFRQVMFAEFELWLHQRVEDDKPVTPAILNEKYRELNVTYYGEGLVVDEEGVAEWARIPHFYYNFYVYQYASGISAALGLAERLSSGEGRARENYLRFLSSGSSAYPIDLLKVAGVDMSSPEPIRAAIDRFGSLVEELEGLLSLT